MTRQHKAFQQVKIALTTTSGSDVGFGKGGGTQRIFPLYEVQGSPKSGFGEGGAGGGGGGF